MSKKISEMTLEELWQLFPIQLTEHDERWNDYYYEMKSMLDEILTEYPNIRINHIGSTAIHGIWAKPIVDLLIEIDESYDINKIAILMEQKGVGRMYTEERRISLNCGYTVNGFADKVYHFHLRYIGDNDELYFRDYLNEFDEIAKSYEKLKLELWPRYKHNRDGYTAAKTEFIAEYTKVAKEIYGNKYSRL